MLLVISATKRSYKMCSIDSTVVAVAVVVTVVVVNVVTAVRAVLGWIPAIITSWDGMHTTRCTT